MISKTMTMISLFFCLASIAGVQDKTLQEFSHEVNKSLPATYDSVTKLIKTSVENNNLQYHFVLDVKKDEFTMAMPKVREQVLKTICKKPQEVTVLKKYKASIFYIYESVSGQLLGEFMIRPDHCK